jgi:AraC-like DNA-binding protein
MKASYEHIDQDSSHIQLWISQPAFEFYWHYHPELELTFILKGSGERIVGDHIESFTAGDLVLLGPNLPHTWTSSGTEKKPGSCQAVVVQFRAGIFENSLAGFPEFDHIRRLVERSARGIKFNQAVSGEAGREMSLLNKKQGLPWLTGFWTLLDGLSKTDEFTLLSSAGYSPSLKKQNQERIDRVFHWLNQHHSGEITLKQAADMVFMTETSFSRFFKKNIGITFNGYLNELRLSTACRLLVDHPEKSKAEISWESGFRSSTHFNRMFLKVKGLSPSSFRKIHMIHKFIGLDS